MVEFESHLRNLDGFVVFFLEENESESTFEKTFRTGQGDYFFQS